MANLAIIVCRNPRRHMHRYIWNTLRVEEEGKEREGEGGVVSRRYWVTEGGPLAKPQCQQRVG